MLFAILSSAAQLKIGIKVCCWYRTDVQFPLKEYFGKYAYSELDGKVDTTIMSVWVIWSKLAADYLIFVTTSLAQSHSQNQVWAGNQWKLQEVTSPNQEIAPSTTPFKMAVFVQIK